MEIRIVYPRSTKRHEGTESGFEAGLRAVSFSVLSFELKTDTMIVPLPFQITTIYGRIATCCDWVPNDGYQTTVPHAMYPRRPGAWRTEWSRSCVTAFSLICLWHGICNAVWYTRSCEGRKQSRKEKNIWQRRRLRNRENSLGRSRMGSWWMTSVSSRP